MMMMRMMMMMMMMMIIIMISQCLVQAVCIAVFSKGGTKGEGTISKFVKSGYIFFFKIVLQKEGGTGRKCPCLDPPVVLGTYTILVY